MGRCNFSDVGYGMTEGEALRDAIRSANEEHGHEEGDSGHINSRDSAYPMKVKCLVKPKPAKTCKVEKSVHKGARKWVTKYFAYTRDDRCIAENVSHAGIMGEARKYALEHNETVNIELKKVLVGSNPHIATVRPNKSQMGKWVFSGTARE